MVNPVPRAGPGPDIPMPAVTTGSFPSANSRPQWNTIPNYNTPIMDPSNSNTLGIPWYSLLTFVSIRASFLDQLNQEVITAQDQITVLQGQVSTLQGQVSTLNSQVSTLQSQVSTLQSQMATANANIATLQSQMVTANNNIAGLRSQMDDLVNNVIPALENEDQNLQTQINTINTRLSNAGIP